LARRRHVEAPQTATRKATAYNTTAHAAAAAAEHATHATAGALANKLGGDLGVLELEHDGPTICPRVLCAVPFGILDHELKLHRDRRCSADSAPHTQAHMHIPRESQVLVPRVSGAKNEPPRTVRSLHSSR
jgi:hypothetical protein